MTAAPNRAPQLGEVKASRAFPVRKRVILQFFRYPLRSALVRNGVVTFGFGLASGGRRESIFSVREPDPSQPRQRHPADRPSGHRDQRAVPIPGPFGADDPDDVPEDGRLIGLPDPPPRAAAAPAESAGAVPQKIIDWSAVPEVQLLTAAAAEQARVETEERRWDDARKILRTLGFVVAVGVALVSGVELLQRLFNAAPSEARLAALGAEVGAALWQRHNTLARPLVLATTEPVLLGREGARGARYRLVVTLRLRESLYAPADSNGAQPYLNLQRSVAEAHTLVVRDRLYLRDGALATPPVLPVLIAPTHRAGERLVIEVPVEATRGWWGWRLEPRLPLGRLATAALAGEILASQPVPHLVFGSSAAREPMRTLQREARDYIVAVQRAARGPRIVRFETPE